MQVKINMHYIIKRATSYTISFFSLIGIIGLLVPLSDILPKSWNLLDKIFTSILIILFIWITTFILAAIITLKKSCVEVVNAGNNHHVYVCYGDIFSSDIIHAVKSKENNLQRIITIAVNRCFDTIVDNDLIMDESLHGKAMKMIYSKEITPKELNCDIKKNLSMHHYKPDAKLTNAQKRKGNLKRYPVGSVAEYNLNDDITFFFFALSTFNNELHAETSDSDHVLAIIKLLEFCSERSQGRPVIMPIIGAHGSNTRKNEKDILEYMISLIKMNKNLITFDLYIVIRENRKDTIPIMDLYKN